MGNDHPIVSMNEKHPFSSLSKPVIENLKEKWAARINSPEGFQYGIKENEVEARQFAEEILKDKMIDYPIPFRVITIHPDSIFSELDYYFDTQLIGNIHGITIHNLADFNKAGGIQHCPIIANLIRNPVSRFHASVSRAISFVDPDCMMDVAKEKTIELHGDTAEFLKNNYKVDWGNVQNRFWFWAFYGLGVIKSWTIELTDFPEVFHFTMEKVMGDPEYFSSLLYLLTQGTIEIEQDYLQRVFSSERQTLGRSNPLEQNTPAKTPEEAFAEWPDWVQHLFRMHSKQLNFKKIYSPYGYDFSFLDL